MSAPTAGAEAAPTPRLEPGRAPWILLALPIALGVFLRVWNAGAPPIFLDEIHAIRAALLDGYGHIFVTYGSADSGIPLTLWNRLLAQTIGMSELSIRLPGLIFGCALLPIVAVAARRTLSPSAAVLLVGAASVSPWLIYLTREARPYPLCYALFAAAAVATFGWRRGAGRGLLIAGGVAGALALWFHPIVFPALAVLALVPLGAAMRRRARWRDVAIAGGVFLFVVLATMGPPLKELTYQLGIKKAKGQPSFAMIEDALLYLHGLPVTLPLVAFWLPLLALGALLVLRRLPLEGAVGLAMLTAQLVALWVIAPWLVEVPWIAFRYVGHLYPLIALLALAPLAWGLDRLGRAWRRPLLGPTLAATLVLALAAVHLAGGRYTLGRDGALNQEPEVMLIDETAAERLITSAVTIFDRTADGAEIFEVYGRIRDARAEGGVLEVPYSMTFPLYEWYRRIHGRPMRQGALDLGYWMPVFAPAREELDFHSVVSVDPLQPGALDGIRFVVVHKHPRPELATFKVKCEQEPLYGRHLIPTSASWGIWHLEFGDETEDLDPPASLDGIGRIFHDGPWLRVYEISAREEG